MPIRTAWKLPLLLLILLLCTVRIANAQSKGGGGQPDGGMDEEALYVASVAFHNNFRCTNRYSHPNPFPTPEYLATYPPYPDIGDYLVVRNLATACRKGSSIQVSIHVAASSFTSWQGTFRLTSVTYGEGSESWNLIATPSSFSVNLAPNGGQSVVTTLSGVPDFVYKGNLTLRCQIQRSSGIQIPLVSPSTAHRVYLVYDTPQSPMATPWTEALEDACGFARYRSTASDVARYCTTGLFFAQRFAYPNDTAIYWLDEYGLRTFRLTDYYNTSGWVSGNCADVSAFLCICQRALGLPFTIAVYISVPAMNQDGQFNSNRVCLIGSDPASYANYTVSTWAWHQIALSSARSVYDVCAAQWQDLSGYGYQNPPVNWPLGESPTQGYWQTDPGLGLVAAPNPTWPRLTDINSGSPVWGEYVPSIR